MLNEDDEEEEEEEEVGDVLTPGITLRRKSQDFSGYVTHLLVRVALNHYNRSCEVHLAVLQPIGCALSPGLLRANYCHIWPLYAVW